MIRRAAIWLLLVPLLLALLAGAAFWWILETPAGTRWLWQRVAAAVPGELTASSIEGALADGLSARGVRYANAAVEVEIASAAFSVNPDLLPPAANVSGLRVGAVTVRLRPVPPSSPREEDGVSLREVLAALEPPVPVHIDVLALDGVQVLSHDGRRLFSTGAATLAGDLAGTVTLRRTQVDLGDVRVEAAGSLGLNAPHAVDADFDVRIDRGTAEKFPGMPLVLDARVEGDLSEMRVDVSSQRPSFRLSGTVFEAGLNPRWDLRLRSNDLRWPLAAEAPAVRGRDIELRSRGTLRDYGVEGTADVEIRSSGPVGATVDARGDLEGIRIERLLLAADFLQAAARGNLRWSSGFSVEGEADVARFDPRRLTDAWPAGQALAGSVAAGFGAGRIEIARLHAAGSAVPVTLDASGTIDGGSGTVDLALDWRDFRWPLDGTARIESDTGTVRVAGRLDAWRVDGRVELGVAEFPEGSFTLRGEGDRARAAITVDRSELMGGTAAGTVSFDRRAGGRWSASVTAADLHTASVLPDWPGVLNARFDARGRLEPLSLEVDLRRFDGSLRGLPVSGEGGLRYAPGELRFDALRVDSGESFAELDGDLRGETGIDFRLDVASLGAFLRDAGGALRGGGNLSLSDGFPVLDFDLSGDSLAWRDVTARTVELSGSRGEPARPLVVRLRAEQVAQGARTFDRVTAAAFAGPEGQRLEASAAAGESTVAAGLEGAFDDWRRPRQGWRGRLETLDLDAGPDLALALADPAGLTLTAERLALEETCLAGDGGLRICGGGHWSGGRDFRADAALAAFPVDALRLVTDTGLSFTQRLDGTMTFSRSADRALSGEVQLDVSAGRIRNRLDERLETTTGPGRLRMHLQNGQLLSGQLHLPFSKASEIEASFDVLDVARGEDSPVEGRLELRVADIGVAAGVVPVIDAGSGRLQADLGVSGTLGHLRFTGQGSLENGRLSYEPLGLELRDLELRADVKSQNRLELEGTFRAGEGTGRIDTSADYLAGRQAGLRVSLSGRDLTVIDVPDVRVVANPELEFGLNDGIVSIDGRVVVPKARLRPANLTAGRVRESEDVVVVAGGDPAVETEEAETPGVAIEGEVEVVLGDDIVVELDNTEARVSGSSRFRWSGPPIPVANGQYQVTGRFQAYGQLLEITEGTIGFSNAPADNPLLRIRAEREIFGNSQIRSAGVLVSGTAKDPDVEVYTNPLTTEARALTLLVTGSDFNYEQGVGAVDVGTYIAPKLYLSYGIGLFDRENVISVRYDIAKGFGIKASSSARTDGVDLSYTIER